MIDAATLAGFRQEGAAVLRQVFTADAIDTLRAGIDLNLANLSPRAKLASSADDPGRFVEDFCNWRDNPHYLRFILDSRVAALAGELMQSGTARLYHDHMLTKEAGTRQRTPWHQDQPYYNIDGRQNVSFWIPVDAVSRETTLEFVAGSHLGPWLMPRSFRDREARWFPEGSLVDLPDVDTDRAAHAIRGWALQPGDAVAFHMLTLHGAAGTPQGARRRVFSVRFIGDDVRHAPRRWPTSPEFPGLAATLPAGAPLDHPLFPLLWRRDSSQGAGAGDQGESTSV
jgi:ectoine hydroxylase-related dioxygenase (phytanoyl-CoA dioxygenase family)